MYEEIDPNIYTNRAKSVHYDSEVHVAFSLLVNCIDTFILSMMPSSLSVYYRPSAWSPPRTSHFCFRFILIVTWEPLNLVQNSNISLAESFSPTIGLKQFLLFRWISIHLDGNFSFSPKNIQKILSSIEVYYYRRHTHFKRFHLMTGDSNGKYFVYTKIIL